MDINRARDRRRGRHRGAVSPFAPLTALGLDLFVPLAYASTSADGQLLYEDDTASAILDAAGDPIGGVRDLDGNIVATQSVDSERPVFAGDGLGATFHNADLGIDSAAERPEMTMCVVTLSRASSGNEYVYQHSAGSSYSGVRLRYEGTSGVRCYFRDTNNIPNGSSNYSLGIGGLSLGGVHVLTLQYEYGASGPLSARIRVDGSTVVSNSFSWNDGPNEQLLSTDISLGAAHSNISALQNTDIALFAIDWTYRTGSALSDLESALMDLASNL